MNCDLCGERITYNARGECEHNCQEDWEKCTVCDQLYDPLWLWPGERKFVRCRVCLDNFYLEQRDKIDEESNAKR